MRSKIALLLLIFLSSQLAAVSSTIFQVADSLRSESRYQEELEILKKLNEKHPQNEIIYWKIARVNFDLGENSLEKEEKKKYFYQGFEAAKKALKINPNSARANHWYAVLIGRVGMLEGTKQKITNSYQVKKYALKAIELDPEYDGTYHLLGRWHYEIADLSWIEKKIANLIYEKLPEASFDKAIDFFNSAIHLNPDEIRHHFWLGKTYFQTEENTKAENCFQKVLQLESTDEADKLMQSEAEDLLEKVR